MKKKEARQKALLSVIRERRVRSQNELRRYLKEVGFDVTQATLSRDIKELGIVKTKRGYQVIESITSYSGPAVDDILKKMVVSVDTSHFVVVIRTVSGYATPVAYTLEKLGVSGFLGAVAGVNTVMGLFKSKETARLCARKIHSLIEES